MLDGIIEVCLDRLLPAHCLLCGLYSGAARLCTPCSEEMPRPGLACRCCALPCSPSELMVCGQCLAHSPAWTEAVAGLLYDYPVDHLVRQFKFQRSLVCGQVLADELVLQVQRTGAWLPQVLVPVPLHFARRFRRGFNQAEFLARQVGRQLRIPVCISALRRTRNTPAQSGLGRKARGHNLRGAFSARDMNGLELALVDDVFTTGATLEECVAVLKSAGAARIAVWVAARAQPGKGAKA